MSAGLGSQAGTAMRWRAAQLAGVQLIYFVRLLILAKLLAPDAFGLLAIAVIAVGVFMRLSDLGMIQALVQRRDATLQQYDAAWTVGVVRAALAALLLSLAAPLIARMFDEPRATGIIQVLALRPLIEAAGSIGVARLTRELKFRELALMQIPGAIVDLVVAVATAPVLGVWALVLGALSGAACTLAMSYVLAPHRPRPTFRWDAIAPLLNYGRWVLLTGIVGLAGTLATQLALSRMLGAAALGLYFLAGKLAFLPIEAASAVIGAVAFPMFAGLRDDPSGTARAFATLLTGLLLLLFPIYALVIVLAPQLEQALGANWAGTAPIMQIMAIAGVTAVFGEIVVPLLMGRGRADQAFVLEIVQTGVLLVVLLPCLKLLAVPGAALAWLLGNAASMVLAVVWAHRMLPGALASSQGRLVAAPLIAVVMAGMASVASGPLSGITGLVAGGAAGTLAGLAALWALDRTLNLQLGQFRDLLVTRTAKGSL
jgi:lipopolysaccharide exporter